MSNIKDTFAEKFATKNVSSAPKYEDLPVFKAGISSSYDGWAKCKEKVPDVSDPIKMLKQHAIPNSSLHKLKIYSSKACRKTSQDELYV